MTAIDQTTKENSVSAERRIMQALQELLGPDRTVRILTVGRTGTGKSSTINSLIGRDVAPVERFKPGTMTVQQYDFVKGGVRFQITDTPGLCDELPESGNDLEYLRRIASSVSEVDVIWWITRLDDERIRADEKRGLRLITDSFGGSVWRHSVVVFTGADRVPSELYEETLRERSALVREEIERHAPTYGAEVPTVAVPNLEARLPSGAAWLGELFTTTFTRLRAQAAMPFLVAMNPDLIEHDGEPPRIVLSERQREVIGRGAMERVLAAAGVGAVAGYRAFRSLGPVPAAVGAAGGAAAGVLARSGWRCVLLLGESRRRWSTV